MKLPLSWLQDFVDAPNDPAVVAGALSERGFEVAAIDGEVIDLEITANRPDCLTISGLAREVATAFNLPLKPRTSDPRTSEPQSPRTPEPIPVSISTPACGRFALTMVDVAIGPSPAWLAQRLAAAGVRPINNVVDVTNYVMLETHPMHAFDAARIAGGELHVRQARPGERLVTLDGQARTLDETTVVVADRDAAVSIAGIMGGAGSEISAGTTRVALEAAWWVPAQVRLASRRLSLKTDAAARFERGADIDGPVRAIAQALALLERIGAGRAASSTRDVYPQPFEPVRVPLRRERLARLLGDRVPDEEVVRILTGLGFDVSPTPDGWLAGVPTFRVDVRREADLIEEVGRHWGFNRIPATFPPLRTPPPQPTPAVTQGRAARRVLTSAGLQEATTFTFIEEAAARPFVEDGASLVTIANPLSEKFAVLRPSLLPGLLDALIYSRRRETADVQLFEAGSVFSPQGEHHAIAWVMTGARGQHWSAAPGPIDFFDAKGVAELLARAFGAELRAEAADVPWFVRGRAARLIAQDGAAIGVIGQLRPDLSSARGLGDADVVVGGEVGLPRLVAAGRTGARQITPLPRFPSIVRDLSILVDERLPAAAVRGTIRSSAPDTLVAVREFDRYQGRGVPAGRVSLSMRLTFRAPDRTLTDAEVQSAVDAIVAALAREHDAALRA